MELKDFLVDSKHIKDKLLTVTLKNCCLTKIVPIPDTHYRNIRATIEFRNEKLELEFLAKSIEFQEEKKDNGNT